MLETDLTVSQHVASLFCSQLKLRAVFKECWSLKFVFKSSSLQTRFEVTSWSMSDNLLNELHPKFFLMIAVKFISHSSIHSLQSYVPFDKHRKWWLGCMQGYQSALMRIIQLFDFMPRDEVIRENTVLCLSVCMSVCLKLLVHKLQCSNLV